jgi:biopolymer transport protein TolQ
MNPDDVSQLSLQAAAHNVSLIALFWQAHIVVKLVMIGLLLASVWCWAIVFNKLAILRLNQRRMNQFEDLFWSGQSLEELYRQSSGRPGSSLGSIFVAAMKEWKRSHERGARSPAGLQNRIEKVMDVTIMRETERLETSLMVLATVGSAAPFIGLFGTVWGIMTSFQAIANAQNPNIAVVAPGIAEALFATAIGLLAAIPAVIAYNKFSGDVARQTARMESFADEFTAILSRQAEEKQQGAN